jgi:cytochrome b561
MQNAVVRALKRPVRRWSAAMQVLHWASAALILGLLALGFVMVQVVEEPGRRFELYQLHKSLGFVALLLVLARLAWRLAAARASPNAGLSVSYRRVSLARDVALYGLMILHPLTGWLMISASPLPLPVSLLGFSVPNPIAPDFTLSEQLKAVHHLLAYLLAGLVALHILAAFKHHVIDGDDVLASMLPRAGGRGGP